MSLRTQHRGLWTALSTPRPTVVPTRRRVDRRFPSLGFTISSPAPWAEVVLATDPALFDPARARDRTQETFYASRSHGGLTPLLSGRARYVVPASVLARLSGSGTIWYLAIAYDDATGTAGTPSADTGASGVVLVDSSLRGGLPPAQARSRALARVLTVLGDDRLAGEDGADLSAPGGTPGPLLPPPGIGLGMRRRAPVSLGASPDLGTDRLEGEDGADVPRTRDAGPGEPAPPPTTHPVPVQVPNAGAGAVVEPAGQGTATVPMPRPGPEPVPNPELATPAPVPGTSALALDDYDDGWDDIAPGAVPALGAPAPTALDDEYPDIDWGWVDDAHEDPYGEVPAYRGLDEPSASAPADTAPLGSVSPSPPTTGHAAASLPTMELPPEAQRRIIELTAGGDGSSYSAINADGPFRGRFGPGHKAYQRYHTGLGFGIADFSQDSGALGQLLRLMSDREPETFQAVFGPDAAELLATTTAPGPSGEFVDGGRGPRVQPIAGADLWEEPWIARFRAAGSVPSFRAAQNQLTGELLLSPMLTVAAGFGLTSERALCMVLDRAIALGEQGARRWIADTVGPAGTPALRQAALAALAFDSIEQFQASVPGLLTDGEFGPLTHATLTAALRALGPASPLPLLTTEQAVAEMARRGEAESGATRLVRLATSPELSDAPMAVQP